MVGKFIKGGKEIDIPVTTDFIEGDYIKVDSPIGTIYFWESYENSGSLSFVNGSQCTGIHQKIVNDWLNDNYFKYNLAHHFYETLITLNVPSQLMRFADQNKTKFATGRGELEPRASNDTEAGRQLNRRVEIYVKPIIEGQESEAYQTPEGSQI